MAVIRINRNPAAWQLRLFACMPLVAASFAAVWLAREQRPHAAIWLASAAALLAIIGLVRPGWMRPLYGVALLVSLPLTWILSHLIMIVLYFGVITPIAIVLRAAGHDPLGSRQPTRPRWRPSAGPRSSESFFRQW